MSDHVPARCCRHVFTPACPIDCLQAVLSMATFNTLARAEGAPFDPPPNVGQVIALLRQKRLSQAAGLGPPPGRDPGRPCPYRARHRR